MDKKIHIHYKDYIGILKLTNCEENEDNIHLYIDTEDKINTMIQGLIALKYKDNINYKEKYLNVK